MSMPGRVSIVQCVLVRTFNMQPAYMFIVHRQNSRDVGCGHISLRGIVAFPLSWGCALWNRSIPEAIVQQRVLSS